MSDVQSQVLARLSLCSRELKAKALREEATRRAQHARELSPEELAAESVRAGASLNVALDLLASAVREMRYQDAEAAMQRALSFAAWSQACVDATVHQQQALPRAA